MSVKHESFGDSNSWNTCLASIDKRESSGIAVNHKTHVASIVDDEGYLHNVTRIGGCKYSSYRLVNASGAPEDLEGISWMYGSLYAVLSERTSKVRVLDFSKLPSNDGSQEQVVNMDSAPLLVKTLDLNHDVNSNKGLEGIAYDRTPRADSSQDSNNPTWHFFTVDEKSPTVILYKFSDNKLTKGASYPITDMEDASDVYYDVTTKQLYVLSDESQKVVQYTISNGGLQKQSELALSGFAQPEGITLTAPEGNASMMLIASELKNGITKRIGVYTNPF